MEKTVQIFDSIRSIGIYTNSLDKSLTFYTQVLGFEVTAKIPPSIAMLKSGNINLYIESGYESSPNKGEKTKVTVFLDTVIPAMQVFEHLKSAGVKILQEKPEQLDDNVWWFQFCDPDGNILEITSKTLEEK